MYKRRKIEITTTTDFDPILDEKEEDKIYERMKGFCEILSKMQDNLLKNSNDIVKLHSEIHEYMKELKSEV